jgi:hypothetical protein
MKVRGLDGRDHVWKIDGHVPSLGDDRPRSKYHLAARELLKRLYPLDRVLEEVPLPGVIAGKTLYVDFYLPLRKILIEVQGQQHYKFTPAFHGNRVGYMAGLRRDQAKREWCVLNELVLIELPYTESIDVWSKRIIGEDIDNKPKAERIGLEP